MRSSFPAAWNITPCDGSLHASAPATASNAPAPTPTAIAAWLRAVSDCFTALRSVANTTRSLRTRTSSLLGWTLTSTSAAGISVASTATG